MSRSSRSFPLVHVTSCEYLSLFLFLEVSFSFLQWGESSLVASVMSVINHHKDLLHFSKGTRSIDVLELEVQTETLLSKVQPSKDIFFHLSFNVNRERTFFSFHITNKFVTFCRKMQKKQSYGNISCVKSTFYYQQIMFTFNLAIIKLHMNNI